MVPFVWVGSARAFGTRRDRLGQEDRIRGSLLTACSLQRAEGPMLRFLVSFKPHRAVLALRLNVGRGWALPTLKPSLLFPEVSSRTPHPWPLTQRWGRWVAVGRGGVSWDFKPRVQLPLSLTREGCPPSVRGDGKAGKVPCPLISVTLPDLLPSHVPAKAWPCSPLAHKMFF